MSRGPTTTTLRRYSNRRLYDTRRSRHVTIEELVEMVAAGEAIHVVDSQTGRDLTRIYLMKVLLLVEEKGDGRAVFLHLHKCPFCDNPVSSTGAGKRSGRWP